MSIRTLPGPRTFEKLLGNTLGWTLPGQAAFRVTRLDITGRRNVPAWSCEWYEVAAYYTRMGTDLASLEAVLKQWPGCVRTTVVAGYPALIRDSGWPGWSRRRGTAELRPQVLALIADIDGIPNDEGGW
jgi:hypothetical protein